MMKGGLVVYPSGQSLSSTETGLDIKKLRVSLQAGTDGRAPQNHDSMGYPRGPKQGTVWGWHAFLVLNYSSFNPWKSHTARHEEPNVRSVAAFGWYFQFLSGCQKPLDPDFRLFNWYIWWNYNDLTTTSTHRWSLVRKIIPFYGLNSA